MSLIEIQDVVFSRGDRMIFDHLSLTIDHHKLSAIMGPSGVGKTTLLGLITGQEKPESGQIRVLGEDIHKLSRKALFSLRKRIGILFQHGGLLSDLTVFENVALPLNENTTLSKSLIKDLVLMKLELVGLRGVADDYPNGLSGGMARRVAFARALALDPPIILYDEPFTGQDPISMGVLTRLISDCTNNLNMLSVIVSHDVEEVLAISDEVAIIVGGKIIASGTSEQVKNSQEPSVKQFINGEFDGPIPFHKPTDVDYPKVLLS